MSKGDYEVFKKFLKEADFTVLILKVPSDEIEDKLAYMARDKGQVSRSFFEDYIIATCVANINQLLYHLNQQVESPPDLLAVRHELMLSIIDTNPLFNPSDLIVNKNFVIKIKQSDVLEDGEKLLTDNKYWDTSYYENINKDDAPEDVGPNRLKNRRENPDARKTSKPESELKDVDDLEFTVVQKWWKRIGQYVSVKQFNSEDAEDILRQRYFHNRTSFQTFIVSMCVVDFEDLFSLLDNMGIPARVAAPILMYELYQLCHSANEFLTYDNAQDLAGDEGEEEEEDQGEPGGRWKKTTANRMQKYMKQKPKKGFKDVPKEDLLKLGDNMKVFLVGQNEAVDQMTDAIQRASVGLKDPSRPIGSFLFAGQTGIGKTLATKVLADELIKGKDNIVTIDCSEYSSDHEYAKLIGAPSGYIGHEAGGFLTNAMMKNPFSVVVFDEVEKASYKVHELLLQVLEEGRLTDGKGRTVSFGQAVVVMTSNIGVKEVESIGKTIGFGDVAKLTDEKRGHAIDSALKKKFKPEFINRIDSIINFKSLVKKDYMRIIDIELYKLNDNLRSNDTEYKKLELKFDTKVKNFIYKEGIDEEYGARPLKRTIEKLVATPLAQKLLKENVDKDALIETSVSKSKITFKATKSVDESPFYMSKEYNGKEKGVSDGGE
jgi:ATP-dependent Clp protease ATP-binding subunit ClpA